MECVISVVVRGNARIRVRDKQHSNSLSSFGVSPRPTRSFPHPLSANLSMLIHVLAGACSGFRSDATLSALGPAAEDPRSRSRADEPERTLYQPHRSSCVKWKNKSVRHGSKRNEFCIAQDDYVQAPKCMLPNFQKVCGEINSRECRIGIGLCTRRPRHDLHQHGKGSLLRHEVVGGPL